MKQQKLFIGIMSGTSMDGIDCVLVRFDSEKLELIASHTLPYPQDLKSRLLALCKNKECSLKSLGHLHTELGERYSEAVLALLKTAKLSADEITAIGNHGQTIFHAPNDEYPFTMQIGNNAVLAARTSILTIGDFRSLDIAYGGQGAPLTPAFHAAYFKQSGECNVVVNVGGISNITVLSDHLTIGFDTGPGNVLMDGWINRHHSVAYDKDGEWAASGKVNQALLTQLLKEPYFSLPAPKSTGRELFNLDWLDGHLKDFPNLNPVDVQATLLALTAHCITQGIEQQGILPKGIYLCGGGAYNKALLKALSLLNPNAKIGTTDALGINPSWVEAIAFAWLAKQQVEGKVSNLPQVTGAERACSLGARFSS